MFVRRHVRGGGVLVLVIFRVPRNVTQYTQQRRAGQLMSKGQTDIHFQGTRPSAIRTRTNQLQNGTMNRRAQRNVTKVTTTTMILTRGSLSANKAKPTVSVSRRGRTSGIINKDNVSRTIVIVININGRNPYSNTTEFQVTRT